MTLRYVDSYGYLPADSSGTDATNLKLDQTGNFVIPGAETTGFAQVATDGAFGDNCLSYDGGAAQALLQNNVVEVVRPMPVDITTGFMGRRFFVGSENSDISSWPFLSLYDLATYTRILTITFEPFGTVGVYRGRSSAVPDGGGGFVFPMGTLLGKSRPGCWSPDVWFYVEVGFTIDPTNGAVEVRINTDPVVNLIHQNTQATGATGAYANGHGWGAENFATFATAQLYSFKVGDMYLADGAGSVNNNFLGNVRARLMMPAGAGASTDFAKTGAATNWQAASNLSLTDSSYVSSDTVNDEDLYTLNPILPAQPVHGVQVRSALRMDEATQRVGRNLFRVSTTTVEGADHYVDSSYHHETDVFELDPSTGLGLTGTIVNGAQAGIKVQA